MVETAEDTWTMNSELNLYHVQGVQPATTLYLQQSFTYSTKSDWDFAISSQNIPFMGGGAQNYQMDTYAQAAKTLRANGTSVVLGGMYGYQLYPQPAPVGFSHQFYWLDADRSISDEIRIHSGAFYVNSALSTMTAYVGMMTGIKITHDDWRFQADYFGGHTNVSGATVTLGYFVEDWFQPYLGVIVPERNSGNEFAGVAGFNISTGDLTQ